MIKVRTTILLILLLATGCQTDTPAATQPSAPLQRFEFHALKMGSDYNLVLYATDQAAADAASKAADAEIERLNLIFSDYSAESEISRLSRATHDGPMSQPVPISDDLFYVAHAAQRMAAMTDGAFDITIGPYVQLWRRSRRQQQLPTPERLAEMKSSVGWTKLRLSPQDTKAAPATVEAADQNTGSHTAQLLAPKMRLDLGGIAMGYISDRVLAVLRERGIRSALCDLSGDLALGDPPPGKAGWRVAIQSLAEPNKVVEYLELANCGVSTSGDTYRFVEIDGVRYSHIVDSRTGLGLTQRIGVTVIAPDGMRADLLATTVSALGAENGLAFVEKLTEADGFHGTAARITSIQNDMVNTAVSKRYKQLQ